MVQSTTIPIDVAFLTYDPRKCSDTPVVKQDNSCVITYEQLKRHRAVKKREKDSMDAQVYHHYKWYNSMLCHELKSNPEASNIKIIHWHIESGNMEAFMLNGKLYKNVSIIIGEMEHWYCANVGKEACHVYGSRYRKNTETPEQCAKRLAIFTIDDNEAHFVVKDENISKCTMDICANNCIECKKYRSPFSKNSNTRCACFPSKEEFRSILESDEDYESDDEDEDIVQDVQKSKNILNKKGLLGGIFKLKAINEE